MNTETQVAPAATESIAAPADTAVAEPNTTEGVGQTAEPTETKAEKTPEQRELEYLRRKATKADRNNARLYQESESLRTRLEQLERSRPAEERPKVEVDPQEYERTVRSQAQELARADKLNDRCNALVEKGKKEFPDFAEVIGNVASDLPLFGRNGPTPALEAILEADNPPALLHYLGKNPDVTADLADLSPIQLTRRLDAIERELKQPPKPSTAPKPHEPEKSGSGPTGMPDASKDPKAWMKWRNAEEKAKRQR